MAGRRAELGEDYLSQVAHEFRGSLNAILGWAEFLRRAPAEDAARIRAAETIIRHARQQSWMVGELLDTWRLAAGTLQFSVTTFDLADVLSEAVDAVQPFAYAREVQLQLLTSRPPTPKVRGDPRRFGQVLTTLLANSVHFAPERGVVLVRLEPGETTSRLVIHDDGPAVAPSALPYLFERARPLEAARTSPRAAFRLGLSLVRDVIARHGGTIEAVSAGDEDGMTFRIVVPSMRVDAPALRGRVVEVRGLAPPARLDGLRVLLVDDEADAREALAGILRQHGAAVRMAGSAAEAIAVLQHDAFDVLLADIAMPGADGYDLIRYIRGLPDGPRARLPAVAVTAFTSDLDRQRALDAGYQVHLSKPIDPAALVTAIAVVARPVAAVR